MKRNGKPAPPAPAAPVWAQALCDLLQDRWERYRQQLKACRRNFSTESVHESRVAARRLRAALELLAAAAGAEDPGKARRALKRHLRLFATLRDAQVQQSLLPGLRLPRTVREGFEAFLQRREAKATRRAKRSLADMDTHSISKAVRNLAPALQHQAVAIGEGKLRGIVEERFRRVCERCDQLDAQLPETIHATRVAFKGFRYSVEMLAPLLPGRHPAHVSAMRSYQALMGAVQDACVNIEWFEEFAATAELDTTVLERVRQRLFRRRDQAIARYVARADTLRTFWPI